MKHVTLLCLLITAVYIPLAYLDYQHTPYSDGAEHGAVLRELIRDIKAPGEPMLETFTGKSPRYVPSLFLMASVARLAGMNALSTIKLFSILIFIFFLTSIIFFVRQYFQDPEQAFWSVACMLFLWGTGWTGANAYMFSALVYTAWYPSLVSLACVFISLAYACRFLRNGGAGAFAGWCLFGAAAFVNHPLTASFLWMASILLTIEIKGWRGLIRPWFAIVFAASIAIMVLWPYYDFFTSMFTITSGSMADSWDYSLTRSYLYSDIALRTGPALAVIPILFFYILKKKYGMLTKLWLASLCIYAAGYYLHISLAERFIFAIIFSSQILVSRYACTLWQDLRQHTARATQTACAALLAVLLASGFIGQLYLTMQEYIFPNFTLYSNTPYIRYEDPTALHKQFALYIQPDDIVFSDLYTSWGIPLYTGAKIVSLFHTPPHVKDNDARKTEVNRFYDPSLSNLQRLQILKNFNATKLVIHFPVAGQDIRKQITSMGLPLIMQSDEVCIFNVPSGNDRLKPTNMYHN
jgi:hypothetical protein